MKAFMRPVEMLAWFKEEGNPVPLKLKDKGTVIKVEQVISRSEEKLAGNRMFVFQCQTEINGELRRFEVKFELLTCKWFLYKM
jgi:hypothetical protein